MMLVPNPGSREASLYGCSCPLVENNFGIAAPMPPDGWYLDYHCYVHVPTVVGADDFDYEDD